MIVIYSENGDAVMCDGVRSENVGVCTVLAALLLSAR